MSIGEILKIAVVVVVVFFIRAHVPAVKNVIG
jgi:hypothetical protein